MKAMLVYWINIEASLRKQIYKHKLNPRTHFVAMIISFYLEITWWLNFT